MSAKAVDTSQENVQVVKRWFEEVWNQRRRETIDEIAAPDAVLHGLGGQPLRGPAGFLQFYEAFLTSFPDVGVTVEDVLVDGNRSAVRLTARATHGGPAFGLAATGTPIVLTAMVFMHWKDGKVIESWNEVDMSRVATQLAEAAAATSAV